MQFSINIVGTNHIEKSTTIHPGDALDLDDGECLLLGSYADYQQLIREDDDLLVPLACEKTITIKDFFSDVTVKGHEKVIWFEDVSMTPDELSHWLTYPVNVVDEEDDAVVRHIYYPQ